MISLMHRLQVAWAVIKDRPVMYRMALRPWSGPRPEDGPSPDAWVMIKVCAGGRHDNAYVLSCSFVRPVVPLDGDTTTEGIQSEFLPYVWVREQEEQGDG